MVEKMEFGISLRLLHEAKDEARTAEALGYDYLLSGEHVSFHGPVSNTIVSLAAAAGATERIKLMSGIVLVPLYPPALLAKQVAMLDVVSGGRYSFGVGVGGEMAKEFEACGVPVNERGARTNEALEIITRLLTEKNVSFQGRFNTLNDITIQPSPVQKPRVPIWVAGRQDAAIKRTARYADGWLPYMYTPEMLADSMTKMADYSESFGRPRDAVQGGLFIFTCVHEDRDTALELANRQLSLQYNQDFSKLVEKYTIAGSPEDCQRRLREYYDAGARTVMFSHGCPADYVEQNTRLIAEGIVSAFR